MSSTNDQQIALDVVSKMKAGMVVAELTSKEYSMFYPGIDTIVSEVDNQVMYFMGTNENRKEISDIKALIRTISEIDVDGRDIRVLKLLNSMKRISVVMMRNYDLLEHARYTRTEGYALHIHNKLSLSEALNAIIKIADNYDEIVDGLWLRPRAVLDEILQGRNNYGITKR